MTQKHSAQLIIEEEPGLASIKINQEQTRALNTITEKLEEVGILNVILKTHPPLWIGFNEDPDSASAEQELKYNRTKKRGGETERTMRSVSLDQKSREKVLSAISYQRERSIKKIYDLANRYAIDLSESDLKLIGNIAGKKDAEQSSKDTTGASFVKEDNETGSGMTL